MTRFTTALALTLCSLAALIGCDGEGEPDASPSPTSLAQNNAIEPATPTEALTLYLKATRADDRETVVELLADRDVQQQAARMRNRIARDVEYSKEVKLTAKMATAMDDRRLLLRSDRLIDKSTLSAELGEEFVDGKRAWVDVREGEARTKVWCVWERRGWRISMALTGEIAAKALLEKSQTEAVPERADDAEK